MPHTFKKLLAGDHLSFNLIKDDYYYNIGKITMVAI
jgi:hypothetical protein